MLEIWNRSRDFMELLTDKLKEENELVEQSAQKMVKFRKKSWANGFFSVVLKIT